MDPGEGTVVPSPRQAKGRTKLGWKAWPCGVEVCRGSACACRDGMIPFSGPEGDASLAWAACMYSVG